MEAGCEPGHQELSDPGKAGSGLLLLSGKHRQGSTGPQGAARPLVFMMINDQARGRRGESIAQELLIALVPRHSLSSRPLRNEVVDAVVLMV